MRVDFIDGPLASLVCACCKQTCMSGEQLVEFESKYS